MGSVFHRYMCILLDVKLIGVYVHSLICETHLVQWCCMDLWSIDRGSICIVYMCILLEVKLIGVYVHSPI